MMTSRQVCRVRPAGRRVLGSALLLLLGFVPGDCFVAPAETYMGDVQRIMYVHVPTAWNAMLALHLRLRLRRRLPAGGAAAQWDARLEAAHRGRRRAVHACSACRARSGPSRPGASGGTGTRASPPPRSWSSPSCGILALRQFVDDPVQARHLVGGGHHHRLRRRADRLLLGAWWNSLHQMQSTPETVSARVPSAAAHQRLRHPVPHDRADRAARPHRRAAPARGAGAARCRGGSARRRRWRTEAAR